MSFSQHVQRVGVVITWWIASVVFMSHVVRGETPPCLFVSLLKARTIVTFQRDPRSGRLTRQTEQSCPAEPAIMCLSPDRRYLYVSFRSTGQLASFRIDDAQRSLIPLNVVAGGADPAYLLVDASSKFLLAAYYVANKVTVHALAEDGSIRSSPRQTVLTGQRAHGIAFDSKNQYVYVSHTGANRIFQFHFDASSGRLRANDPPFLVAGRDEHPRHVTVHPSDRWAYANGESGDTLSVYRIDPNRGTLTHQQTINTIPQDFDAASNSTARCEMTVDGRRVYVANRGHDSLAAFTIDPGTGMAELIEIVPTERTPRSFTIDPAGQFLYAAGETSGRIAQYRIATDGRLKREATYEAGPVPWCILAR